MTKPQGMAPQDQVDLSEFFRLSRPRKPPCRVGLARSQLSETERAQLDAAIATNPGIITNAAIVGWLRARKLDATPSAVVSHRRGSCTCGESASEHS